MAIPVGKSAPEAAGAVIPAGRRNRWYAFFRFFRSPLFLCLVIACALRIWLMARTNGYIDGDESLVGIQAIHILHGERPVYFYGQAYMGSLEAYLAALVFAVVGPSTWALRGVGMLLSLVVVYLTWVLAGMLANHAGFSRSTRRVAMIVAALTAAIAPLYDGVIELRMLGGYIETFVLLLVLLILALRLAERWRVGAGRRELALCWAAFGFVAGVGLWVNPLIISAVLAALLWIGWAVGRSVWIAWRRGEAQWKAPTPSPSAALPRLLRTARQCFPLFERAAAVPVRGSGEPAGRGSVSRRSIRELLAALVSLPAACLGALPAILWGATHNWANVAYLLDAGSSSPLYTRLNTIGQVTGAYFTCVAPRLIGGAIPHDNTAQLAVHGPLLLFGLVCVAAALFCLIGASFSQAQWLRQLRAFLALPALFALCAIVVFCTSSASASEIVSCRIDFAGRYATPMALALPFFFAAAFLLAYFALRRLGSRRIAPDALNETAAGRRDGVALGGISASRTARVGMVALSVVFLLAFVAQASTYLTGDPDRIFETSYCQSVTVNDDAILAYLRQQHIRSIWGDNMLVYPLVFKSGDQIIGADPTPLFTPNNPRTPDRVPPGYNEALLHADRPSLLVVVPLTQSYPPLLQALDQLGVTYRTAWFPVRQGYRVLVVTPLNRTVSPLESPQLNVFHCVY